MKEIITTDDRELISFSIKGGFEAPQDITARDIYNEILNMCDKKCWYFDGIILTD